MPPEGGSLSRVFQLFKSSGELRVNPKLLNIGEADILASVFLSFHHVRPFNRMLIAQARTHDLQFATTDPRIQLYDVHIYWK